MVELLIDPNAWATFALLILLELVLGVDNVLLIAIVTDRLPAKQQPMARYIGLGLALVIRIVLLFFVTWMQELTDPVLLGASWRDMILISGGGFLMYKAVTEMHHVIEKKPDHEKQHVRKVRATFGGAVVQIVLMDVVFSIDSVITAVGVTHHLEIIIPAVILSFVLIMAFANVVSDFVNNHPSVKILALALLMTIAITLIMEGFHKEIPKEYIYIPMGFALIIELLQMRYDYTHRKAKADAES